MVQTFLLLWARPGGTAILYTCENENLCCSIVVCFFFFFLIDGVYIGAGFKLNYNSVN